jgi:iron complex outermembrane receptor protein
LTTRKISNPLKWKYMQFDRNRGCNPMTLLHAALGLLFLCLPVAGKSQERQSLSAAAGEDVLDEVVVTARRRDQSVLENAGNIEQLTLADLAQVQHQHIHELMTRIAGVWMVRGSGQEHLTAIRSPVLTGAGSCGGFLFLEDGIPTRPSGFCNVNQMLELDTEQAASVEVIRGPANALYGSNALHGMINVLMPTPQNDPTPEFSLEYGANNYLRSKFTLAGRDDARGFLSAAYTHDGGFRDDSGYDQFKLHAKHAGRLFGGDVTYAVTMTGLDQDTAGYIPGKNAYRDRDLSRKNFNPGAFRKVSSQRAYALFKRAYESFDIDIRPYARHSKMEFLMHYLPGTPLEKNGHVSAGFLSALTFSGSRHQTVTGLDMEVADIYLEQYQEGLADGSAFLRETRPQGQQYDYDVLSKSLSLYAQSDIFLSEKWTLGAGLRFETVHYDYDNRMLAGNTRDDGSECGFGGCLYSRPADRQDRFSHLAPKLSISYRPNPNTTLYTALLRGFRAPQTTELYRLQNGQLVSDLDIEVIDSLELGFRQRGERWNLDLSLFEMKKRDSVFIDSQGFNVSGARTRHTGLEISALVTLHEQWTLQLDGTWARHVYDFDYRPGRGEQIMSGNDVDTAPRLMGSARLGYRAMVRGLNAELQWVYMGSYFLEAGNRFRYAGHHLLNFRLGMALSDVVSFNLRLNNLADTAYADRADYAFGNYRYFPGRGRELFAEIRYSPE